jgi:hypothetical protein
MPSAFCLPNLWHVPHLQLASAEMPERLPLRCLRNTNDNLS